MIAERGVDRVIEQISGITPDSQIGEEILSAYQTFQREYFT
jgi:hypothetical protein